MVPHLLSPVIVAFSLDVGAKILATSGLSFLGLGTQPPTADWGSMLATGRQFVILRPHVVLIPGLAIFAMVLALNLVGDALRDLLDPRDARGVGDSEGRPTQPRSGRRSKGAVEVPRSNQRDGGGDHDDEHVPSKAELLDALHTSRDEVLRIVRAQPPASWRRDDTRTGGTGGRSSPTSPRSSGAIRG